MRIIVGHSKIAILVCIIIIMTIMLFWKSKISSRERFLEYSKKVNEVQTSYGIMSYIDEGTGVIILSSHGICGGYDQAFATVSERVKNYRVLAPSRFGYPGSNAPINSSVNAQVKCFVEILDNLNIDKVYILGTSAGGTVAIKFALDYPDRTKGLILYCSGYPPFEEPDKCISYNGPPKILCNDFMMWCLSPLFEPIMGMKKETINEIMPLSERKAGILIDSQNANTDMIIIGTVTI